MMHLGSQFEPLVQDDNHVRTASSPGREADHLHRFDIQTYEV